MVRSGALQASHLKALVGRDRAGRILMDEENGEPERGKDDKPEPSDWKVPALICAFFAALAALTTNLGTIIDNAENLPGKISKAAGDFRSWYHDDASWNGHWTNNPQAYVDAADMNLSAEDMSIDLNVNKGDIDGVISTKSICYAVPYDFLLLKGSVSGSSYADVIVWDTFDGHSAEIAKLRLKRAGIQMTVVPIEGTVRLFPKEGRLALDPTAEPFESKKREAFCSDRLKSLVEAAKKATAIEKKRLAAKH